LGILWLRTKDAGESHLRNNTSDLFLHFYMANFLEPEEMNDAGR
jgi:hypothetical protein